MVATKKYLRFGYYVCVAMENYDVHLKEELC